MKPPGAASRTNVPLFLVRNRVDSPTPILVAVASSLARSIGPGHAEESGIVTPRGASRVTQVAIAFGSKVRLLTMWVACRRLSHIDCTVRSSLIVGWVSG